MKKILFTRHAKSSWSDASLSDHDRPLNKRGIKNARILSKTMRTEFDKIQEIHVSSAKRAQETAKILQLNRSKITVHQKLYTFNLSKLEAFIYALESTSKYIQLVGHNPVFTDFVNAHSLNFIKNIPTCGMVLLQWDTIDKWDAIKFETARLVLFDTPKRYSL